MLHLWMRQWNIEMLRKKSTKLTAQDDEYYHWYMYKWTSLKNHVHDYSSVYVTCVFFIIEIISKNFNYFIFNLLLKCKIHLLQKTKVTSLMTLAEHGLNNWVLESLMLPQYWTVVITKQIFCDVHTLISVWSKFACN